MLDGIGKKIMVDSSKVAEAKAVVAGIELVVKNKWTDVIIKTDSQTIASDIKKKSQD